MATFEPEWDSLKQYRVPDWFSRAKFGIFIHWGIYSVPAVWNEWYPRIMYKQGLVINEYHRDTYGENFGYKDFIPLFTAEKFDADEWMDLFRRAGARYIVPVAEHHDGFPMYATPLTRWNAASMGPRRDVLGELSVAARKHGLTFGLSSHRAEHWWYMNTGRGYPSDVEDDEFADFYGPAMPTPEENSEAWAHNDWASRPDARFLDDWYARAVELVDRFRPSLIYFDTWIHQLCFKPYLQRFAAYYYNRVPDGVITYKLDAFPPETAVFDVERGYLAGIQPRPWQTCTSVSRNSWGYICHHIYREPAEIIHQLIDVVSKNGCLLLNVGPKPDGTIPDEERQILCEIGDWLKLNSEAIFDSRPWRIHGEGPTGVPEGQFNDNDIHFTNQDIRFTQKDGILYACVLGEPGETVNISSLAAGEKALAGRIVAVEMLGCDVPVNWSQTGSGLSIRVSPGTAGKYACVFKITLE